jgi:hypothetical protein
VAVCVCQKPLWLAGCATIQSFADGYRLIIIPSLFLISPIRHSSLAVKITIMKLILAASQINDNLADLKHNLAHLTLLH